MAETVVIGAGISGLVAAYRLAAAGEDVLLVEASERAGGVIRTREVDGFLVEQGPNSVRLTDELEALVEDLGLGGELITGDARAPRWIYHDGALRRAPMGPASLVTTPLLSARAKLRLLAEPLARAPRGAGEPSIEEFVVRRLGREVHDVLVSAFVSGVYAGDTSRLSAEAVFPQLVALEREHGSVARGALAEMRAKRRAARGSGAAPGGVGATPGRTGAAPAGANAAPGGGEPGGAAGRSAEGGAGANAAHGAPGDASAERGPRPKRRGLTISSFQPGLARLPERIAEALGDRIRLGTPVEALERRGDRFEVRTPGERIDCSRVVVATAADAAAALLGPLSPRAARLLASIEYPPLASIALAYEYKDVAHSCDGFGFLAPRAAGLRTLGAIFGSSLFPGRAPEGWHSFTCFVGGATDPGAVDLGDEALVGVVAADLGRAVGARGSPRVLSLTRWRRAIPQYTIGHTARVAEIEREAEALGLTVLGNFTRGVSVGECVAAATRAAERLRGR